ncbi:MAG: hypothetical protein LDL41_08125 [Coleofasciculus sp. S288]|nr:hypothetical protein [Coleofasciculus sp. S288]
MGGLMAMGTGFLIIRIAIGDRSEVSVSTQGSEQADNLEVVVCSMVLDNQGKRALIAVDSSHYT